MHGRRVRPTAACNCTHLHARVPACAPLQTNNAGMKLRDGANINCSLLALANCINALGKNKMGAAAYVPYRNSKLTRCGARPLLAFVVCLHAVLSSASLRQLFRAARCALTRTRRLLKDSLRGNSRTAMIATISAASDQYHHRQVAARAACAAACPCARVRRAAWRCEAHARARLA